MTGLRSHVYTNSQYYYDDSDDSGDTDNVQVLKPYFCSFSWWPKKCIIGDFIENMLLFVQKRQISIKDLFYNF